MAAGMKLPVRDGSAQGEENEGFLCKAQRTHEEDDASQMGNVRRTGLTKMRRAPSVCSSVRGSSIAVSGLRLRRASQLAGRRRGTGTPVPSWKIVMDGSIDAAASETPVIGQDHQHHLSGGPSVGLVSARKLAASLWELQALPFSGGEASRHHNSRSSGAAAKPLVLAQSPASSRFSQRLLKPPSMLANKMQMNAARRTGIPMVSASNMATFSKDLSQGPATSNEFVKVLIHVQSLEEQHRSNVLLVDRLRHELDEAHRQLEELMQNEKAHRREVENVTKKLVEERALWKERQKESTALAVQTITEHLYHERKSKSRLESLHRTMAKEYHELKKALVKALHDLERERKARELMEDVCDELAREIGEDKARVEEMRRESAKVREEVEEERKMLQMAEMWREERVQMKLMEAKLELEEKNTALDKLRSELEAFLKAKRAANMRSEGNQTALTTARDGHSREPIVGHHLGNSFHCRDAHSRVPGQQVTESQSRNSSGARQNPQEYEGKDGSLLDDDVDHHQGHVQGGEQCAIHQRICSPGQWKASPGRHQGLQRTRSSQLKDTRHANHHYMVDVQGDQCSKGEYEAGAMREWREERPALAGDGWEETINMWPSDSEGSQGWSSFSPRPSRSIESHEEALDNLKSLGTKAAQLHQNVETSQDLPVPSVFLSPMHQQSYVKSSPTRPWNHQFWSSPELGSPHQQAKSKGSRDIDMAHGHKGYSLKARLLEAKLEGQQARLRG